MNEAGSPPQGISSEPAQIMDVPRPHGASRALRHFPGNVGWGGREVAAPLCVRHGATEMT